LRKRRQRQLSLCGWDKVEGCAFVRRWPELGPCHALNVSGSVPNLRLFTASSCNPARMATAQPQDGGLLGELSGIETLDSSSLWCGLSRCQIGLPDSARERVVCPSNHPDRMIDTRQTGCVVSGLWSLSSCTITLHVQPANQLQVPFASNPCAWVVLFAVGCSPPSTPRPLPYEFDSPGISRDALAPEDNWKQARSFQCMVPTPDQPVSLRPSLHPCNALADFLLSPKILGFARPLLISCCCQCCRRLEAMNLAGSSAWHSAGKMTWNVCQRQQDPFPN
jgi:hypothetical protein